MSLCVCIAFLSFSFLFLSFAHCGILCTWLFMSATSDDVITLKTGEVQPHVDIQVQTYRCSHWWRVRGGGVRGRTWCHGDGGLCGSER